MSRKIMAKVFALPTGVRPADRLILLALADHADTRGVAYPSARRLARMCGMHHSSVRRRLNHLQREGYLRVEPRTRDDGGQSSNRYTLALPECPPTREAQPPTQDAQVPYAELYDTPPAQSCAQGMLEPTSSEPTDEPPPDPPTGEKERDWPPELGGAAVGFFAKAKRRQRQRTAVLRKLPAWIEEYGPHHVTRVLGGLAADTWTDRNPRSLAGVAEHRLKDLAPEGPSSCAGCGCAECRAARAEADEREKQRKAEAKRRLQAEEEEWAAKQEREKTEAARREREALVRCAGQLMEVSRLRQASPALPPADLQRVWERLTRDRDVMALTEREWDLLQGLVPPGSRWLGSLRAAINGLKAAEGDPLGCIGPHAQSKLRNALQRAPDWLRPAFPEPPPIEAATW